VTARAAEPDDLDAVLDAEEPLDDAHLDVAPLDDEEDPFLDDEEPDEDVLEDDLDPELDEEDADEADEDVEESLEPTLAADEGDDDEDTPTGVTVVPPDAEFDDDDPVPAVDDDEDDDDEIEGLRDGEFICRGCFMAKRETQLADPEKMLCRDCA
jgi:hypothetical protein